MAAIPRATTTEVDHASYRAFVVGPDGHVLQRDEFWCGNDEETKERARQFVDCRRGTYHIGPQEALLPNPRRAFLRLRIKGYRTRSPQEP